MTGLGPLVLIMTGAELCVSGILCGEPGFELRCPRANVLAATYETLSPLYTDIWFSSSSFITECLSH